jgi:hypothetical protein
MAQNLADSRKSSRGNKTSGSAGILQRVCAAAAAGSVVAVVRKVGIDCDMCPGSPPRVAQQAPLDAGLRNSGAERGMASAETSEARETRICENERGEVMWRR